MVVLHITAFGLVFESWRQEEKPDYFGEADILCIIDCFFDRFS